MSPVVFLCYAGPASVAQRFAKCRTFGFLRTQRFYPNILVARARKLFIGGLFMHYEPTNSRRLTPSQRSALRRVVSFYRKRNAYTQCTSVRFELRQCGHFVSVSISTRRSDCQKYSPRQVFCAQSAHVFIGKRGGLRVVTAENGLGDGDNPRGRFAHELAHVRFMLAPLSRRRRRVAA